MKRSAFLLAALIASLAAEAQVYQYKDASGRMVYTDQPPPGTSIKDMGVAGESGVAGGNASVAGPKSSADRELEFKKRQKEKQEAAGKAEKEAADKAARKEDCELLQRQVRALESGERIATRDEKGERNYMEDSQRAAEIERNRKLIAETCK